MFRGDKINVTEQRAVLHIALRAPPSERILVDGVNVVPDVHAVLDRMKVLAASRAQRRMDRSQRHAHSECHQHRHRRLRSRPVMAYEALRHYSQRDMTFRFVSNVDGTDFSEAVRDLDPRETLFIICSKTFTTLETLTNAHAARAWCLHALAR